MIGDSFPLKRKLTTKDPSVVPMIVDRRLTATNQSFVMRVQQMHRFSIGQAGLNRQVVEQFEEMEERLNDIQDKL